MAERSGRPSIGRRHVGLIDARRAERTRQHRLVDSLTEMAADAKRMAEQQIDVQPRPARIDAPSTFDCDATGPCARPFGTCLVTIGERRIAAAEIGVALPWR